MVKCGPRIGAKFLARLMQGLLVELTTSAHQTIYALGSASSALQYLQHHATCTSATALQLRQSLLVAMLGVVSIVAALQKSRDTDGKCWNSDLATGIDCKLRCRK
eukprot:gnl/TRDRNA2_/TRDRNA2_173388_c3_seq1.p1 gnl/TRDRNA2_/TRDRNA2_173388_c3~~gnl/TRDRNA2_/TRDRNA2_173388_c3_seq1.p1  ORF type:complete len:105 (+),score=2.19 gnl/TRDRNA2_/TRDRNA2_173388_c3_seq1:123-437(+)